ncbi:MAG: CHASE4 domain-containing protein [Verrucomicrobiota bacterium]
MAKLSGVGNLLRPSTARNSLSVKFAVLVAAIFSVALTALFLLQRTQRRSIADLLESETRERSGMMTRVIELSGQSLRDFTNDYAHWDDMVRFVQTPRPRWASINLDPSLETFNLWAIWVLRADGTLVYATRSEESKLAPPPLPLPAAAVSQLVAGGKPVTFFAQGLEGLLELCAAPVFPSDVDPGEMAPRGWVLAARAWDRAQLRMLAEISQCEVSLAPPERALPPAEPNQISLSHTLRGFGGGPVASLVYTVRSEELQIVSRDQRTEFALFGATCLTTAVLSLYFLYRWIMRPLRAIGESLSRREAGAIGALLGRDDELGRVAQLVQTSFEQHAALEQLLEERARLGRELHDGMIQTVYAAGMNLAGARAILRRDPAAAERILDDTHGELNATIRELRDFIAGLEPEPQWHRTYREATQSIVALMQGVRPVASTLLIDDKLAASLTDAQRLHILHVTREAISNSVRHGQARHIHIRFQREAAGMLLEISDDGSGLDPEPTREGGRGLVNLSARARELGGTLTVGTSPGGGGVRITLVIPARAASASTATKES